MFFLQFLFIFNPLELFMSAFRTLLVSINVLCQSLTKQKIYFRTSNLIVNLRITQAVHIHENQEINAILVTRKCTNYQQNRKGS